jgi:transcriptional/translational regulatory protein YebC/TACO1
MCALREKNINRAIKRASEGTTGDFSESTFEAYGFGGASLVINVLSDNANRVTADVKSTVGKREGKIAEQGSVLFMYDKKGKVEVPAVIDEEALLDVAIEAGIDDFLLEEVSNQIEISLKIIATEIDASAHVTIKGRRRRNFSYLCRTFRQGCHV